MLQNELPLLKSTSGENPCSHELALKQKNQPIYG